MIASKENDFTQGERLETLDEGASFVAVVLSSPPGYNFRSLWKTMQPAN